MARTASAHSKGRRTRHRTDFSLTVSRLLSDVPLGSLFAPEGAAVIAALAAEACGSQSAALYRVALPAGIIARLDGGEEQDIRALPPKALERAAAHAVPSLRQGMLLARIWPWEGEEPAASAVLLVLQPPAAASREARVAFTSVERRRVATLISILALREARHEQQQAGELLRRGMHAMAFRPEPEAALHGLAGAIAEASGAVHVAIWLTSAENPNSPRLRALQERPDLAPEDQAAPVDDGARSALLRLAKNGPLLVSLRAVPWLPEALGLTLDSLGDVVVVMPVKRGGAVIGAITGMEKADAPGTVRDPSQASRAQLLEALADQVALSTALAHTAMESQQEARRAALMASLADIGLAKMGGAEMVDAILARVRDHFAAHRASLYLLQRARGNLGARSIQRDEPAVGKVFSARTSVSANGRLLGSLVVRRAGQPFDQAEEKTLAEAATQIALALSSSERYEFQAAMAVLDMLTDLPNRRSAEARLASELTRASEDGSGLLGVALLDIDHFKMVNDTYGHATGDRVLSQIAGVFKAQMRSTDYIARWGGEEFLLLYHANDVASLRLIGERVRKAVSGVAAKTSDGQTIEVAVSLGGAVSPLQGEAPEELIALADKALYEAKHLGRNRSHWADLPDQ